MRNGLSLFWLTHLQNGMVNIWVDQYYFSLVRIPDRFLGFEIVSLEMDRSNSWIEFYPSYGYTQGKRWKIKKPSATWSWSDFEAEGGDV